MQRSASVKLWGYISTSMTWETCICVDVWTCIGVLESYILLSGNILCGLQQCGFIVCVLSDYYWKSMKNDEKDIQNMMTRDC